MRSRLGQSILEYTMIVAIIMVVLYYMGTGIKRGVQSLVKVTADQVGNQQNADQDFNDAQQGFMLASNSQTQEITNNQNMESGYYDSSGSPVHVSGAFYNESTYTMENTITNGGFNPNNQ